MLDPSAVDVSFRAVEGGLVVDVSAATLALDVSVLADRIVPDGVVDDMLVSLLPGEAHTFLVSSGAGVSAERVAELAAADVVASVVRSVNSCARS